MLHLGDATVKTDRLIAALLRSGPPHDRIPPYSTSGTAARPLRSLMEEQDCRSRLEPKLIEGQEWFVYFCSNHRGPVAQGIGQTEVLAICDAFIKWAESMPRSPDLGG
jgi:hypothetical protein